MHRPICFFPPMGLFSPLKIDGHWDKAELTTFLTAGLVAKTQWERTLLMQPLGRFG